jgi:hypothetical protein
VIGPAPERPARSASLNALTLQPIGLTTPSPVTATRCLMDQPQLLLQ